MRRTRRTHPVTGPVLVLLVAAALLAAAGPAAAGAVIVPPRPGQVGIGMGANGGALLNQGDFGRGFSMSGEPGVTIQLRYRMRYERGFGLTFDQQELDVRDGAIFHDRFADAQGAPQDTLLNPASSTFPRKLNLYFYGLEFYQMFDTRTSTVKMLSIGMGIAHPVITLNDKELWFPAEFSNDGFYLSAGGSIERYFVGSFGVDLSVRYRMMLHESQANHDLHASLGIVWYASL